MKRRDFLLASSALLAGSWVGRPALRPQVAGLSPNEPTPAGVTLLRRNVGIFNGRGGAIGWYASPSALAVVDSQFPEQSFELLEKLPGRAGRHVDVLFNSHHHPDHLGGNSVFRPVTKKIVTQQLVPDLQLAQARERNTANYQIYADTLYADSWRFDAGDEVITARYVGYPAHTTSDSVIYFEKANVVHVSDLVFNRYYPMTDRPGGCVIKDWIKALEETARYYPADALYIFGHAGPRFGLTGTRAELLIQRDYLTGLLEFTDAAIKSGKSRDEHIGAQEIPGFPDWRRPLPHFLARNLAAAWDELTGAPRPSYGVAAPQIYQAK